MKKLKGLLILLLSIVMIGLGACGDDATDEEPNTSTPGENTEENTTEDTDSDTSVDETDPDSPEDEGDTDPSADEGDRVFTLEELSEYDGQDGNPAYVAVDGVVYDVTDVESWQNGEHLADLTAGQDLTEEISQSPHGDGVLENLPVVGVLEDQQE